MLLDIIKQFNWVDIFVILILFRVCYIAMNRGFNVELFKLPGTILAIYLSFHYYSLLTDAIVNFIGDDKVPLEFLDFICFIALAILGYLFFIILREAFLRFIKLEAIPTLNKWGGLFLGIGRAFLLTSLIIFALVISSVDYFKTSVTESYSGSRFYKIAPATYQYIWGNIMSKFTPAEKFNETILEVEEGLTK